MSKNVPTLATLRLSGSRFQAPGMAAGSAQEISTVNEIVYELVEYFWRAAHPDRERLERNLRRTHELRFSELKEGSVVIELNAPPESSGDQDALLDPLLSECLVQAAETFEAFILASSSEQNIPEPFYFIDPSPVRKLASTLGADEALQAKMGKAESAAWGEIPRYTRASRERVLGELRQVQKRKVDYQGLIQGTDLASETFTFWDVETGNKAKASYVGKPDFRINVEGADEAAAIWVSVQGEVEFTTEKGQHSFTRVDAIATESLTEAVQAFYGELSALLAYEVGWEDGEVGAKISESVVNEAKKVVFASAATRNLPTTVSPTIEGGVNLSWIREDYDFSVELTPNGFYIFHKTNVVTGNYVAKTFNKLPKNLRAQLKIWVEELATDE